MGSRSAASRSRSAAPRPDGPARSRSSTNRKYAGTVPMSLSLRQLHPIFAAEATGVDLSTNLPETTIAKIRAAIDRHAVLVFPDQHLDDETQLAFAGRFGPIEPPQAYSGARRLKRAEFADVSNLDADNRPRPLGDRRRMNALGNRLWHTDASFRRVPGALSMLYAHRIPAPSPKGDGETEFADMRAAYDALPDATKEMIDPLVAEHSIFHSRALIGLPSSPTRSAPRCRRYDSASCAAVQAPGAGRYISPRMP